MQQEKEFCNRKLSDKTLDLFLCYYPLIMSDDPEEFKNRQEILKLTEEGKNNYQKIEDIVKKEDTLEKIEKSDRKFEIEYLLKISGVISNIILTLAIFSFAYYTYNLNILQSSLPESTKVFFYTTSIIFYSMVGIMVLLVLYLVYQSFRKFKKLKQEKEI